MPRLIFTGADALARIQFYEEEELAEPVGLRESELTSEQTEAALRERIKSSFTCYVEQRAAGKYDGPLLRKLRREIALYRLLRPWFWAGTISSITDLQTLVDRLPKGMDTPWRNGDELPRRA